MKKILIALCLITSISLFACSNGDSKDDAPDKSPTTEESTPDKSSSPKSDDLYSFEVVLDGVDYKLPIEFSELAKNGWVIEADDLITLEPSQHTLGTSLTNGDKKVNAYIINNSGDVLSVDKCFVGGLSIDDYYAESGSSLVLPKGITLGSSKEDVISAYGEPTDTYSSEYNISLTYEADTYKTFDIDIDVATNKVSDIKFKNFNDLPEETSSESSSDEDPIPSLTYKSPKELTDDLLSFNVKYDEVLYTVPVPLSELIKNGWVVESAPAEKINAKDITAGFTLRKGNNSFRTTLYNELDTSTSYKNCLVTSLLSDDSSSKIAIELPKGIKVGSTKEDVEAAFPNLEVDKDDSSMYTSYNYSTAALQDIDIIVSKETNKVYRIEVSYVP